MPAGGAAGVGGGVRVGAMMDARRLLRAYAFFLVGLFFGAGWTYSHADYNSADWYLYPKADNSGSLGTADRSTATAGVKAWVVQSNHWAPSSTCEAGSKTGVVSGNYYTTCNDSGFILTYSNPWEKYCPNGGTVSSDGTKCIHSCPAGQEEMPDGQCVPACGANMTRVGGVCQCNAGYDLVNGVCQPGCGGGKVRDAGGQCVCPLDSVPINGACTPCPPEGTATNSASFKCGGSSSPLGTTYSMAGCGLTCRGGFKQIRTDGTIGACTASGCSYTGHSAPAGSPGIGDAIPDDSPASPVPPPDVEKPKPPKPPAPTPDICAAQGKGSYTDSNGNTTCLDPEQSPGTTEKTTSSSKTESGPSGSKSQVITTKQKCQGGDCEIQRDTQTTTTNPSTGEQTTQSESKTQSKASFCEENPNATVCKEPTDECLKYPNRVGCAELGEAEAGADLGTQAVGVNSIGVVSVASNAQCPQGAQLPKGLGTYDFTPMCDFATAMRPLVLALAWLTAGLIVLGIRTD